MGNENAPLIAALENLRKVAENVQFKIAESDTLFESQSPQSWPVDFFETTAGAFANESFERGLQGDVSQREAW